MSKRRFDDFDNYAAGYREIHNANIKISGADSAHFAEMKVKLVAETEKDAAQKLLDFGCGDGLTEYFLAKYFPSWQLTGIDVSAASIAEAKQKKIADCLFKSFDGSSINEVDASFDIVFVAGVLHHIAAWHHAAIVTEIYRVLKPGGRLYLFEHNPKNPLTRYLVNTCVFDKDAVLLKAAYTKQLLVTNGFTKIQMQYIIFFPQSGIFKKARALEKLLGRIPFGGQYVLRAIK